MSRSQAIHLDLSRQQLMVKPNGPLPKFYPAPKAIMVTPIYDTSAYSAEGSYRPSHRDSIGSDREPARSYRSSHSHPRGAYTDSEYDDDREPFAPSYSSSYHGRDRTPSPRRRYRRDRDSDDSYPERSRARHSDSHQYDYPQREPRSRGSDDGYLPQEHGRHSYAAGRAPSGAGTSGSYHAPASADYSGDRGLIDDAIQKYLQLIPLHPKFCWSNCTGRKKAVCIGINYVGQKDELKGCANDARNMRQFLMDYYGFKSRDILLLTDDGRGSSSLRPTRKEMFNAMGWLVKGAQMHDSLFFHYSGHGGQSPDASGKEADGMDEVIFPVDYDDTDDIIDDELNQALVAPLPSGCRLTAVIDSCHSGTVLDLPYLHSAHGRLRGISHISKRAHERGMAPAADVISFAACKDDEKSADTFHGGVAVGAMSYALIQSLQNNPHQTYEELLKHLRDILIPKYHQKAQLSGTHPVDLNRQFIL
ncbi:hypothetical protein GALMADRAFT_243660 [Galerina marginata CBS 339.88]|uniref:Peptidase C14 caspase domain-containing protein n=1 Tax=Galerina marginata (strain CBS 339.88) TaxID=685588 RepID=A0A067TKS5_GALM3|nr:hypothetical protein GALMADRAFT_243660 [Galerina marginata CBS 339.88]